MAKVVINGCFGGFSLPNLAIKAMCDRKGIPCYFFKQEGIGRKYSRITDEEAFQDNAGYWVSAFRCEDPKQIPGQRSWSEMTEAERRQSNKDYDALAIPYCRDTERDDVDLVAVVEALGAKANGSCASLKIVEVPDGVSWEVKEYDGNEWVAEQHRTWG